MAEEGAPAASRQSSGREPDGKFIARYFMIAVAGGWLIEGLYGFAAEPDGHASIRTFCLLWFASAAAFFAGTISGFLFAVPKAASDSAANSSRGRRYKINTNLEDVSDWLTKIILGLGLVHVDKVIHFVDSMGDQVASAVGQAQGAKIIAISAMVYGFVSGFIIVYTWTRTALRRDLAKYESDEDENEVGEQRAAGHKIVPEVPRAN